MTFYVLRLWSPVDRTFSRIAYLAKMNRKIGKTPEGDQSLAKCVYAIAKVFGYWPYAIRQNESVKISVCNWLWMTGVAFIYLACASIQNLTGALQEFHFPSIGAALVHITTFATATMSTLTIAWNVRKAIRLRHINAIVDEFDHVVSDFPLTHSIENSLIV